MPHKKKVNDATSSLSRRDDGRFVPRLEETLSPPRVVERRRVLVFLRPVLRFEQRAFFRRRVRVRDDDDDKNRDDG